MTAEAEATLTARMMAVILGGWGLSAFHRPYLFSVLDGYAQFPDVMPWAAWAWAAILGSLLLWHTRPGTLGRLLAHAYAGTFFFLAAGAHIAGVGLSPTGSTYTVLGYTCAVLWARSAVMYARRSAWWARLIDRPPQLIRRLADWGRDGRH